MLSAYEQHLLACYLANVASAIHHLDIEASRLAWWVAHREDQFRRLRRESRPQPRRTQWEHEEGISAEQLLQLAEALRGECAATRKARLDRPAQRLRCLAPRADLSRADLAILELLLRYETQPTIESMVDNVFALVGRTNSPFNLKGCALSVLLGISTNTVRRRFRNDAPLVRSGLVSIGSDGDVTLVGRLHRLATVPGDSSINVIHLLLGTAPPSDLEWSDFDHVAADRDHVERLMKGALDSGVPGVNVLLYGPPGTGKTQFCKVLAERLGVTLFSVGESDEDGDEPARGDRLQELRLAQRLLGRDGRSLLLFDEMEDLLADAFPTAGFFGSSFNARVPEGGSRVFTHRLLEQAPTPMLWTMNNARTVSDAILRRMMFALELRPPTVRVRARMWARQLQRHGIEAGPDDAHSLAAEFEATPGVAAGATAAARLGGGDVATVRHGVGSLSRVLSCGKPPRGTPTRFDPGLVNTDPDPVVLAERLVAFGEQRFSLCLQGPPGAGKSAFVRYLAQRLGLEIIDKRASDLLSMWVGGTEQRIAAAFAEARDADAFLVFDEADSLLADRRFAQRSWEISQVNEMLAWMESHPLPFACTTNFGEHLDPATLRRFVFKMMLGYLTPAQAATAFRGYYELTPPAEVAALTALTPGDFATVRREAEILGRLQEPAALVRMLRAECDAKPDRPRAIGFRT